MSSQRRRNSPDVSALHLEASDHIAYPTSISIRYSDGQTRQDSDAGPSALTDNAAPAFMYGSPEAIPEGVFASSLPGTSSVFATGSSAPNEQGTGPSSSNSIPRPSRSSLRPPLGSRSLSSPLAAATGRSSGSITARMSSGLKQLTQHHPHHQTSNHEWSLFEQMMEIEGQLPSGPPRTSQVASTSPNLARGWRSRGSASNVRSGGLADVLQSPLEETHAEDVFREAYNGGSSSETQSQEDLPTHDYDSAYDSDTSASSQRTVGPPGNGDAGAGGGNASRRWFSLTNIPTLTLLQRNVLKCAIAYFIASLFTFSPTLSNFIGDLTSYGPGSKGPSPSAHMVATMYEPLSASRPVCKY